MSRDQGDGGQGRSRQAVSRFAGGVRGNRVCEGWGSWRVRAGRGSVTTGVSVSRKIQADSRSLQTDAWTDLRVGSWCCPVWPEARALGCRGGVESSEAQPKSSVCVRARAPQLIARLGPIRTSTCSLQKCMSLFSCIKRVLGRHLGRLAHLSPSLFSTNFLLYTQPCLPKPLRTYSITHSFTVTFSLLTRISLLPSPPPFLPPSRSSLNSQTISNAASAAQPTVDAALASVQPAVESAVNTVQQGVQATSEAASQGAQQVAEVATDALEKGKGKAAEVRFFFYLCSPRPLLNHPVFWTRVRDAWLIWFYFTGCRCG